MSSYPMFSGNPFSTNPNQLAFNLNQNVNMPPPQMNSFQSNSNMAFLSFPPPTVPVSFHVLANGPRFPNSNLPISATNNTNSNGISSPSFTGNIPGTILRPPAPFPSSNMVSPASFSMPPPTISPQWGSSNFAAQQINSQEHLTQDLNPWAALNNFPNSASFNNQIQAGDDIKPWASDPSALLKSFGNNNEKHYNSSANGSSWNSGSFNNMQSTENSQHSLNANLWSSNNSSSGFTNSFQDSKYDQPQFRQARDSVNDINPWAQPPNHFASVIKKFQYANGHQNASRQHNFNGKRRFQQNYNHNRGNSKNFRNDNRNQQWQGKRFKDQSSIKTEANESSALSCDTCDRTFYSEEEYRAHVSEHIKCSHANCHFEAHPKIVALHKKMQHDTGYADVINKLKNSDEIEKWRAERRRRFPTAENILKRKAEQAEKEARGEVIENKEFGKFNKNKNDKREFRNKRPRNNRSKRVRFNAPTPTVTVSDSGSDSDDDSHIKLRKFAGVFAPIDVETCEKPAEETEDPVQDVSKNPEEAMDKDTSVNSECLNDSKHQELVVTVNTESGVADAEQSVLEITIEEDNTEGSTKVNPITISSEDDDMPVEIPIVKARSLVSYQEDSDDESPVEIPVSKKPLTEISNSNAFADKNVSASTSFKTNTNVSDDESPVEIPVSKKPLTEILNSEGFVDKNVSASTSLKTNTNDSDDEAPVEIPVSKKPLAEISNSESFVDKDVSSSSTNTKSNTNDPNSNRNISRTRERNRHPHNKRNEPVENPVRKSSLLEKLLADDIRHERNVIMQCIRHVVKKNFFGIGSNK